MPTRTDLQVRVLDLLGVTQVGQDPAAEDVQKVDSFINSAVKTLADERVAAVDPTAISPGLFDQFAIVDASACAPAFEQPRDKDTIAAEKDALRIAQAAEGGAFSRRRAEFSGSATRALAEGSTFAGTAKTPLVGSSSFAGSAQRALTASSGLAGTIQRPLQGAK